MARRYSSRVARLLVTALVLAACSVAPATVPTTTTVPLPTTSTTFATPTTSTTLPPTTTTSTTLIELPDIDAVVKIPEGDGPFPAVVLVHGGGWISGEPGLMTTLQNFLTDEGFVTINTRYKLSNDSPGFPEAVTDVACAVNHAAAMPESDGTVAVVGHSAGAHIGAVVALTGDLYSDDCPVGGDGVPDKFVGLAGPYDVERLGFLMIPFFGTSPTEEPDLWEAGNPQRLTAENQAIKTLIMFGDRDGIVDDSFALDFHSALESDGVDSTLELIEGARHMNMRQPDWVGDLIVVWLER